MRRVVSLYLPFWATDRLASSILASSPIASRTGIKPTAAHRVRGEKPVEAAPRCSVTVARRGAKRLVVAADAGSRALGIVPGMAVSQAQAMLPDLALHPADPAGDAAGLHRLALWCLRHYSPISAPDPPDGVWIDMTGCAHFWSDEAAMLADITGRIAAAGIGVRAAIAATPGAAHAVARFGAAPIGIVADSLATLPSALAPLPVAALRLDAASRSVLAQLGFDRIGELERAARGPLARRLGRDVLIRLDQALGRIDEPLQPVAQPAPIDAECRFVEPVVTREGLALATTRLIETLCQQLERAGLGASRIDLVCRRVDATSQVLRIGTAAPSRRPKHLARLLAERLETIDPGFGIEQMTLAATLVDRLAPRQLASSLAGETSAPDLSGLVDTLINRLGPQRLYRVAPVESEVPERSVKRIPPLAPAAPWRLARAWPRPARLITPPVEVEAMSLMPDYPPARFTWANRAHRIVRADGPERIFGEWWKRDGEAEAVRDYFEVEDEHGQRFWLFRRGDGIDPATGDRRWFLHGMFG